jgi:hypothetical protein
MFRPWCWTPSPARRDRVDFNGSSFHGGRACPGEGCFRAGGRQAARRACFTRMLVMVRMIPRSSWGTMACTDVMLDAQEIGSHRKYSSFIPTGDEIDVSPPPALVVVWLVRGGGSSRRWALLGLGVADGNRFITDFEGSGHGLFGKDSRRTRRF